MAATALAQATRRADRARVHSALIALVAAAPLGPVARAALRPDLAALTPQDWTALAALAQHHVLGSVLAVVCAGDPAVPPTIAQRWAAARREQAIAALTRQADLADALGRLAAAGFVPLTVKGAWLVRHAYPAPELRPMYDIDLLLDTATVASAFDLLKTAGYAQAKPFHQPLEDLLRTDKHMPPLVAPRGTVFELHHRLWEPDGRLDHASPVGTEAAMRARATTHGGGDLAPEDALVHLIVHCVYSHRLGSGPRVLADIGYLLARHPIDWERFWQRGANEGWRAGARLVLHLVAQHNPEAGIMLTAQAGPPPGPAMIAHAPAMLLQDAETYASASAFASLLVAGPRAWLDRARGNRRAGDEAVSGQRAQRGRSLLGWAVARATQVFSEVTRPEVWRQGRELVELSRWLDRER